MFLFNMGLVIFHFSSLKNQQIIIILGLFYLCFCYIPLYAVVIAALINNFNNFINLYIVFFIGLYLRGTKIINSFSHQSTLWYRIIVFFIGLNMITNLSPLRITSWFIDTTVNFWTNSILDTLNNNLLNGLLLIHPPILYIGYVYLLGLLCFWFIAHVLRHSTLKIYQLIATSIIVTKLFFLFLCSAFLGAWWAYQELNWGGWWNWDFIEIIIFFLLWFFIIIIHKTNHALFIGYFMVSIVFFYWTVRLNYINSIHNFIAESLTLKFILYVYLILSAFLILLGCYQFKTKTNKSKDLYLIIPNCFLNNAILATMWGLFFILCCYFYNINLIHYVKYLCFILLWGWCLFFFCSKVQAPKTNMVGYLSFLEFLLISRIGLKTTKQVWVLHWCVFFFTLGLCYYNYAYYFSSFSSFWKTGAIGANHTDLWLNVFSYFYQSINGQFLEVLYKPHIVVKYMFVICTNFETFNVFLRGSYLQPLLSLTFVIFLVFVVFLCSHIARKKKFLLF